MRFPGRATSGCRISVALFVLLLAVAAANGQTISSSIPTNVTVSQKYLFYLHGGVVQDQGIDAVSEYYGPYKYLDILDSLSRNGFSVISERRAKGTDESAYAEHVSKQIDTLLNLGVTPGNIIVVGASQGAYIAIEVAHRLRNSAVKYALLGLCSDYAIRYFSRYKNELCGDFLSIYERSDEKGSCNELLENRECKSGYREIALTMGKSHAFLYQPYSEWLSPVVEWAGKR